MPRTHALPLWATFAKARRIGLAGIAAMRALLRGSALRRAGLRTTMPKRCSAPWPSRIEEQSK
jgi:hypothetical protein